MNTAINGTQRVLEIAKERQVKGMVYLSSMEMYGVLDSENVTENDLGYIDPLNVRSSYSQGKRTSELYCFSYMSEYDIPVKIARIAMTFGAGLPKTENSGGNLSNTKYKYPSNNVELICSKLST